VQTFFTFEVIGFIPLNHVHMLILVSKTVFVSVRHPLVAILFSASAQLVSSGAVEEAQEVCIQTDRTRQAKQAQRADPNTMAISQAAAGAVGSKYETGGSTMATQ
jgi:hypothetical protein